MPVEPGVIGPSARKRRAWDIHNPGNQAIREELVDHATAAAAAAIAGDRPLLDAGCGSGWWLRRLAGAGVAPARLHGIDVREAPVAAASEAVPGADVRRGDVRALPWGDDTFAAAFAFTLLSSLPSAGAVREAVAECVRVLAPGGVLVVWEPRVPTPLNRATRLIRGRELARAAGVPTRGTTVTVLPPVARRLGPAAPAWYPRLARIRLLRSHRLHVLRTPGEL
jgi:SAM-dependent methyltransferase